MGWLRHGLAIAALPFVVVLVVPFVLLGGARIEAPSGPGSIVAVLAGVALLVVGLTLFVSSLRRFAVEGDGTLAPWDPPRRLVVKGPYRFVRNPMISGVILVLFGEALVLRSPPHLAWASAFLALNALYIPISEEPGLEARFGEDYRRYRQHVPRFLPRLRPWEGAGG
jgi:protein-S-isoprenylcysteine O-methyltransferase Ste14